jgi:hypothetical protein
VLLQLALPLRHYAYGGDVLWHEQGMRWAWHVMIRAKTGAVTYFVDDPRTGRTWHVTPQRYLTERQVRDFSGQPDLIAQLARRIRDDYAARGVLGARVRAEAWVSLNGRPPAPMIDSSTDLAAEPCGLSKAAWILPAPEARVDAALAWSR